MTQPYITSKTDFLVRKFRTDDLLPDGQREYIIDQDGNIRPANSCFSLAQNEIGNVKDGLSVYLLSRLNAYGLTIELLAEPDTWEKDGYQYNAFKFPTKTILESSPANHIKYDFDRKDQISARGICHYLIQMIKTTPEANYKVERKKWAKVRNIVFENAEILLEKTKIEYESKSW